MIPVFRPSITDSEIHAVTRVLKSGWLGMGPEVEKFEKEFARWLGRKHAIATNSCTAALHLAVKCLDVKYPTVLTTPLTFVSANLALLYEYANPYFVDVESDTLNMDIEAAYHAPKADVIMPMHYGGHACDMAAVMDLAHSKNMKVIEDCAHAVGGAYLANGKPQKLGIFGDIACFSFHAVKNLTCGEGGMLVTDDGTIAEKARKLRWCGITKSTYQRSGDTYDWMYDVEEVGYKYTMSDINAAVGRAQLKRLNTMQKRRQRIALAYREGLRDLYPTIHLPVVRWYAEHGYHNFVIQLRSPLDRDALREHLAQCGISTSVHYYPNHLYGMFEKYSRKLRVAGRVWKHILTLPMFADLGLKDVGFICEKIRRFYA